MGTVTGKPAVVSKRLSSRDVAANLNVELENSIEESSSDTNGHTKRESDSKLTLSSHDPTALDHENSKAILVAINTLFAIEGELDEVEDSKFMSRNFY